MKISEYPSVSKLVSDDIVLIDGTDGTRTIPAANMPYALMHLCGPQMHRMVYRGKQIGTALTSEQRTAIQAGTFDDLWLGDYWFISGVNYRIVDFNYWYGKGDQSLTTPHVVVVPDTNLGTGKMNSTSTTTGGYTGSEMYTSGLESAKTTITTAFGENVLTHREYLITEVTNGVPSAGAWTDSKVDLMSEQMVFGSYIFTPSSTGTVTPKLYSNSPVQLALFQLCPQFINAAIPTQRVSYWLRDIVSAERFARVTDYGPVLDTAASLEYGIRPVFAVG